ncbi:MAG TPA: FAD:protein FMN transferase [Pirellulales bacterium]|jgi:thiamine biosynthesis lipoprotein
MATRLDIELFGTDAEHLEAVAAAIEDEVCRLDALLSRYNPTSEISRVNRHAAAEAVRVDADVWQLLSAAEQYRRSTDGFFDVTAASSPAGNPQDKTPRLQLDAAAQTVRFASSPLAIDLGGIGKGYALDRAKQLLVAYGVDSALLSFGTSSILAVGRPAHDTAWTVSLRHPSDLHDLTDLREPPDGDRDPVDDSAASIGRLSLLDRSLSCSATTGPGQAVSDIVDPHTGLPLSGGEAVVVLAPTGTQAEALSTALLAMGRRRATEYLARADSTKVEVAWIDGSSSASALHWLRRSHD